MHFTCGSGVMQLGVQGHREQIGGTGHTKKWPCADLSGMSTVELLKLSRLLPGVIVSIFLFLL